MAGGYCGPFMLSSPDVPPQLEWERVVLAETTVETSDRLEVCFGRISEIMYDISGVLLADSKVGLVRSRLTKRLRALGLAAFPEYVDFVEAPEGRQELSIMVDLLTTNKTSFFREQAHFDFLSEVIFPEYRKRAEQIKIWCAACSSGEEPYSLAMQLKVELPELSRYKVKILASDLSTKMLTKAKAAVYSAQSVESIPRELRKRYLRVTAGTDSPSYQIDASVTEMVRFAPLNLIDSWPMRGPFDLIVCRNVMIYFDRPTRKQLVHRFAGLLRPGGYLFVGHSEGLNNLQHDLEYIQPAVYRK